MISDFKVYAPAKLNLYLDVLEKRPDGYHNIKTIFEKIDLRDEIIIKEKAGDIDITVEPSGMCPSGKGNIVYKVLELLLREAGVSIGLDIVIKKRIPVSAGLGGGSSDAAAVLQGVNEKFDLGVSRERLFSIASETGKDIPFFMLEGSFALGMGAGELLEPVKTGCRWSHIIIKPDVSISTAEMYARLDGHARKSEKPDIEKIILALEKKDLCLFKKNYYNIFEEVLIDYDLYIERAKTLLSNAGSGPGFLSGSGPSVFCTVEEREEAVQIAEKIPKAGNMKVFVATTQAET